MVMVCGEGSATVEHVGKFNMWQLLGVGNSGCHAKWLSHVASQNHNILCYDSILADFEGFLLLFSIVWSRYAVELLLQPTSSLDYHSNVSKPIDTGIKMLHTIYGCGQCLLCMTMSHMSQLMSHNWLGVISTSGLPLLIETRFKVLEICNTCILIHSNSQNDPVCPSLDSASHFVQT